MKDVTQSSQDWEDFWYNSPINSPYIVMTDPELDKLSKDYEGNLLNYFAGLTPEQSRKFNKLQKQIRRTKWNLSEELVSISLQQSKPQIDANMLK